MGIEAPTQRYCRDQARVGIVLHDAPVRREEQHCSANLDHLVEGINSGPMATTGNYGPAW